ncbi:hypothetical protein BC567DRAFT_21763 [Phyllosticta citribraziliensis]
MRGDRFGGRWLEVRGQSSGSGRAGMTELQPVNLLLPSARRALLWNGSAANVSLSPGCKCGRRWDGVRTRLGLRLACKIGSWFEKRIEEKGAQLVAFRCLGSVVAARKRRTTASKRSRICSIATLKASSAYRRPLSNVWEAPTIPSARVPLRCAYVGKAERMVGFDGGRDEGCLSQMAPG